MLTGGVSGAIFPSRRGHAAAWGKFYTYLNDFMCNGITHLTPVCIRFGDDVEGLMKLILGHFIIKLLDFSPVICY